MRENCQGYRTASVRAVIRNGTELLVEWLVPKSISFLPGGTIEADEQHESALLRVLREELLCDGQVAIGRYLGKIGHYYEHFT